MRRKAPWSVLIFAVRRKECALSLSNGFGGVAPRGLCPDTKRRSCGKYARRQGQSPWRGTWSETRRRGWKLVPRNSTSSDGCGRGKTHAMMRIGLGEVRGAWCHPSFSCQGCIPRGKMCEAKQHHVLGEASHLFLDVSRHCSRRVSFHRRNRWKNLILLGEPSLKLLPNQGPRFSPANAAFVL